MIMHLEFDTLGSKPEAELPEKCPSCGFCPFPEGSTKKRKIASEFPCGRCGVIHRWNPEINKWEVKDIAFYV